MRSFAYIVMALFSCTAMVVAAAAQETEASPDYVSESPLPKGWPTPGVPGTISAVDLPAYRTAEGPGFWPLFAHISQGGIPMTAPVTMPIPKGPGMEVSSMRFLYPSADAVSAPTAAGVRIIDVPAHRVLRSSHRGSMTAALAATAVERLNATASSMLLVQDGSAILCGYNSPMLSRASQTWEVMLPVKSVANSVDLKDKDSK